MRRTRCAVLEAVAGVLCPRARVVLAVSGGRDSMVLLHAAVGVARDQIALVATFDHGTGPASSAATDLVERAAALLGLPVETGCAEHELRGEQAWREARWRFLRAAALRVGARVATAHTRDDQIETTLIRVLRGAGARGLAGLYAGGEVLRPLLGVSRAEVAAYAEREGVRWVEDPSNYSRRYLRNRVRHDLLPALERVRPQLPDELLALARRAAQWRAEVEGFIEREVDVRTIDGELRVARAELARYDPLGLRVLWPALAARVGVTLDRRGTRRLAMFTTQGVNGSRIQLAGGYEVVLHRNWLRLRRRSSGGWPAQGRPLTDGLVVGPWRFRRVGDVLETALWAAMLPADRPLQVRPWQPGDRMTPEGSETPRRVKGLLRDAGVDAPARAGWPVVLAGDEIVWIPGVRRSAAATVRSGRPAVPYVCERLEH